MSRTDPPPSPEPEAAALRARIAELEERARQLETRLKSSERTDPCDVESPTPEYEYLRSLSRAHEADRQLVAYEIHDGLVQYIAAALLQLESIDLAKLSAEHAGPVIEKVASLLRRAIAEARRVVSGLRPPVLDEQGIAMAIEYLIDEICRPSGIEVEYSLRLPPERLDPLLEGTLYRIVQESLNNISRHSGASRAKIELAAEENRVRLVVRDWGRGFDPAMVSGDHFGLAGIRKRAELAGGRADIESAPGKGTTISVELPLS